MATYCYTDGKETVDFHFPMGKAPKHIRRDGRTWTRDFSAERPGVPCSAGWPIECYASGVHPSQAQELRDYFKRHGCPTEVSADGNPIYRNAAHRKKALKCRGFRDRAAYL